jgi:hypothetical protein
LGAFPEGIHSVDMERRSLFGWTKYPKIPLPSVRFGSVGRSGLGKGAFQKILVKNKPKFALWGVLTTHSPGNRLSVGKCARKTQ